MNKQENYKEDPLRHYIDPERIEKAPDGFTERLMINIESEEALPRNLFVRFKNKNLVPIVSTAVTIILIITAFLIPGGQSNELSLPELDLLSNLKISLPEIDLTNIFSLHISSTLTYVIIGILILSLFDKALGQYFHREK